jgi:hypothetical protein
LINFQLTTISSFVDKRVLCNEYCSGYKHQS